MPDDQHQFSQRVDNLPAVVSSEPDRAVTATNLSEEALSTLEAVAPMLAAAAAGPLVAQALATVRGTVGLAAAASPEQVARAIKEASIEQLGALKAADGEFAAKMRQLGIDLKSLRQKNRKIAQTHQFATELTPAILAFLLTGGFFGLLFLLCFQRAPDANLAMLNIVLGSLGTAWIGAMTYFFGSTQSSRTKDLLLFQSQPQIAMAAAKQA